MKNKENVLNDFKEMIVNSWTYQKMTYEEQKRLFEEFDHVRVDNALKGNYNARWNILQAVYGSYLAGLGYNSFNWRDE